MPKKKNKREYKASDIVVIYEDRERVRQSSHVYGRRGLGGIKHLFTESFDNAIDEHIVTGTPIYVRFNEITKEITVSDNGGGIPHEKLRELAEVMNSSGKYNNTTKNGSAYVTSVGQNGMGMKVINFLSDHMTLSSKRDGKELSANYIDGKFVKSTTKKCPKKEHGTTITFRPSDKYFDNKVKKLTIKHLTDLIEKRLYVTGPQLKVYVNHVKPNGKESAKIYSGYSLEKYVTKLSKNKSAKIFNLQLKGASDDSNFQKGEVVFQMNENGTKENIEGYANTLYTKDGGTHINSVRNAITDFFRKETNNRMSQLESKHINIKADDVRSLIVAVISVRLVSPEFKGQTKDELESNIEKDLTSLIIKELKKSLNDKEINNICNMIKLNARARIESTKIIKRVKKADSISKFSKNNISNYIRISKGSKSKFTEIFLTEGLSAGASMDKARDADSQAIYQIQGKPVNFLKKKKIQIVNNKLVQELSKIYGIEPFSEDLPVFDRINIATDADIDGDHMGASLMVLHYIVFPGVIKNHILYKIKLPLYKIDKKNPIYLINDDELSHYIGKEFMKKNLLYFNKSKFSKSATIKFINSNINYTNLIDKVAKKHASVPEVIELIAFCLHNYKEDIPKWKKEFKPRYPYINITNTKSGIEVDGIDSATKNYQIILVNKKFKKDIEHIIEVIIDNYNKIFGYKINKDGEDISLYKVNKKIANTIGSGNKVRFKGLL